MWILILKKTFIEHFPSTVRYAKPFAYFIISDPHDSPMR